MVSIVAFQAIDPGSIPGHRTWTLFFLFFVQTSYLRKCNIVEISISILNNIDFI